MDTNAFPKVCTRQGVNRRPQAMGKHPLSRPNFKRPMDRPPLFRRLPDGGTARRRTRAGRFGLAVLAWQRQDAWKARAVESVNAQLQGELQVEAIACPGGTGFQTSAST